MNTSTINRDLLKNLVREVLAEMPALIPIGISNRHIHISPGDYQKLFGNLPLENMRNLKQPGEFASSRVLDLKGPKGLIKNVRILGPFREETQVELAKTDARTLGLDVPVRLSGKIAGSPGLTLIGPLGELKLKQGAIAAQRHIHINPAEAAAFKLKDGDLVDVKVNGERPTIFCNTLIRVNPDFVLEMHLDTDEANAVSGGEHLWGQVLKHD